MQNLSASRFSFMILTEFCSNIQLLGSIFPQNIRKQLAKVELLHRFPSFLEHIEQSIARLAIRVFANVGKQLLQLFGANLIHVKRILWVVLHRAKL